MRKFNTQSMKKTIFLIPVLFIAISVIVSCTEKKCTCAFVLNGTKVTKDVEMEKYERNCKDQSDLRENIFAEDSLGNQYILPDTIARFICE